MKLFFHVTLCTIAFGATALAAAPPSASHAARQLRAPQADASAAAARVGRAVAVSVPTSFPSPGTLVLNQSFAYEKTPPNAFLYLDQACLTAGTKGNTGSIPPCGNLAPKDKNGQGALQNTGTQTYVASWAAYAVPVSTLLGVQVSFTIYSFDGNGADGQLLFFTDASQGPPNNIGRYGGELGYTSGGQDYGQPGMNYAYLGVGFDESGQFSLNFPDGGLNGGSPQRVPETITIRGAASTNYYYLGGAVDAHGKPSSLPFDWDQDNYQTRPPTGRTVFVTLFPTGYLSVAVDIHDGNGFVTYYSGSIVGTAGQPAVPSSVYIGVTGSSGGGYNRHQIEDLYVWSM